MTECKNSNCSNKIRFTCSGCNTHGYCGRECQRENWSAHKEYCRVIKSQTRDQIQKLKFITDSILGNIQFMASYRLADTESSVRLYIDIKEKINDVVEDEGIHTAVIKFISDDFPIRDHKGNQLQIDIDESEYIIVYRFSDKTIHFKLPVRRPRETRDKIISLYSDPGMEYNVLFDT